MHAPETPAILKAGARIQVISNEHPEALERMTPDGALEKSVRAAAKMLRGAKRMTVTSAAGTVSTSTWPEPRPSAYGAGPTSPARSRIGRAASSSVSPKAQR